MSGTYPEYDDPNKAIIQVKEGEVDKWKESGEKRGAVVKVVATETGTAYTGNYGNRLEVLPGHVLVTVGKNNPALEEKSLVSRISEDVNHW